MRWFWFLSLALTRAGLRWSAGAGVRWVRRRGR
jgi:hypothetical protein